MPLANRTIRLFVSSTFSDLKAERDALQRKVFPRLKQLCLSAGIRFQAIDLRWGISDEAGRDNKTMRICLRELKRCQQDRPKPNFIILLGERYGWRPPPEILPADMFEQLERKLSAESRELLAKWYRRDDNAVPPRYELQPRTDPYDQDFGRWQEDVEIPLLDSMARAAKAAGIDLEKAGLAIGASATEQEIIEGALKVTDAAGHVRAFFRTFDDLPTPPPMEFVEIGEPAERLKEIKSRLEKHIGGKNVCEYHVPWRNDGIQADDLNDFCVLALKQLSAVVEEQIAALTSIPPDEQEELAHQYFGKERCLHFVGRAEPLARIDEYLRKGTGQPLAIIGLPGSGKSAVMAKAAFRSADIGGLKPEIIARFIGATPGSSDLIQLLRNIVGEIRKRYPAPVPTAPQQGEADKKMFQASKIPYEYTALVQAFHEALQRPSVDRPLFLFLDALDQLIASNNAHQLYWLPTKLSMHVRIIVSASLFPIEERPPDSSDPRAAIIATLVSRLDEANRFKLAPMAVSDGEQMLTQWLADAHRTLQRAQSESILDAFSRECSPLWLRIAVEEVTRLASWDPAPAFLPTAQGLLGQVLDRLSREEEHGNTLVSRTLSYLACARHGLAEDEILDILSLDKEIMDDFRRRSPNSPAVNSLPVAVWVRLHGDLAFFLAEHLAQGISLLGFFHRQLGEAVASRHLDGEERRLTHRRLVDYFRVHADPDGHGTWNGTGVRSFLELPFHLARAETKELDELSELLSDFNWIQAKTNKALVTELLLDYEDALHALPADHLQRHALELLHGGLLMSAHALVNDASQLAGQLVGRLSHFEESVISRVVGFAKAWRGGTWLLPINGNLRPPGGNLLRVLKGGDTWVRSVAVSPDGHLAVSGYEDGSVITWDLRSGGQIMSQRRHKRRVNAIAVLQDGRRAVSASQDKRIEVWNLETGQTLLALDGHTDGVRSMAITPDGLRLISAGDDQTLRIWDLETGRQLRVVEGHAGPVTSVGITSDGHCLISAGEDRTLRVWDIETGAQKHTIDGQTEKGFVRLSISPCGSLVVGTTQNCENRVWDLATGKILPEIQNLLFSGWIMKFRPDGQLVVATNKEAVHILDLNGKTSRMVCGAAQHGSPVMAMAVTCDGKTLVTGSMDGALRLWDMGTKAEGPSLPGHMETVRAIAITPDGLRAVSASWDTTLKIWNPVTGELVHTMKGHKGRIQAVAITQNGRRVVSGGDDKIVRVWDAEEGKLLLEMPGHTRPISSLAFVDDERRVISGSHDGTLRMWDMDKGRHLRTFDPGPSLRHSMYRRFFVYLRSHPWRSGESWAQLRDRVNKDVMFMVGTEGSFRMIESVVALSDGLHVLAVSIKKTAVWNCSKKRSYTELPKVPHALPLPIASDGRHLLRVRSLHFLRSTSLVLSSDLTNIEQEREVVIEDRVMCLGIARDTHRAAAGCSGGSFVLWDFRTGTQVAAFSHDSDCRSCAVSADGKIVVTGDGSGRVHFLHLVESSCDVTRRTTVDGKRAHNASSMIFSIPAGEGRFQF